MSWTAVAAIIGMVIVIIVTKILKNSVAQPEEYPYRKAGALFTPAERSFLGVLSQAVGNDVSIFGKVRVADVMTPRKGMNRSEWQKAFNKISSKHFDFVLCDKRRLKVLCAIELNDSSHLNGNRKHRDEFLAGACRAAGIPLIKVSAKSAYRVSEIQQTIKPYMSGESMQESGDRLDTKRAEADARNEKICPRCSSTMVKRVARKGRHAGKEFWACSSYPRCKYIEIETVDA